MKKIEKTLELGGKKLTLSTGHIAQQANSAVLAQYGETVVIATIVAADMQQELDYFPLTVEYQERLYAGGRIKGSRWVKREGRPTDDEILAARLVDRSIRPLFPKAYKKDVQLILTVLSVDMQNSPDIVAAIAASAAIHASDIPWNGPVAPLRIALRDKHYITNPTDQELAESEMDLIVSTTKEAIVMIEAGALQVSEESIVGGIAQAQKDGKALIDFIDDFAKEVGNKKQPVDAKKPSADLVKKVKKLADTEIDNRLKALTDASVTRVGLEEIKAAIKDNVEPVEIKDALAIIDEMLTEKVRKVILSGKRVDGRKHDEIRPLSAEVAILPRTHGSAIFSRGQTQVLSVATLGGASLGQLIETAEGEEEKHYIHHYSMPPYSVGETGKVGFPSRRDIGHGALAERALIPVIPDEKAFPYTIRVVSEVLSSNGSTSMASVCGSTLSLMDAGVPITAPVAGIAMGLVIEDEKNFAVLTDIMGLEDFNGDMDYKVAGTEAGVTAMQLDVKTLNLTLPILEKALEQAKKARLQIMKVMLDAIPVTRQSVSTFAPKIKVVQVPVEKIGEVIGPGGRMIRAIIRETGAQIDVDDEGNVNISALTEEELSAAVARVESLVKEVEPGEIYEGEVKRIQPFGAFVEVLPGKDGLVHVSDMSMDFVKDPNDVVSIGDKVKVKVKEIDDLGRINLTMILEGEKPKQDRGDSGGGRGERPRGPRRFDRNDRGGGGRRFDRPRRDNDRGPRRDYQDRGGPHFPASRLVEDKRK